MVYFIVSKLALQYNEAIFISKAIIIRHLLTRFLIPIGIDRSESLLDFLIIHIRLSQMCTETTDLIDLCIDRQETSQARRRRAYVQVKAAKLTWIDIAILVCYTVLRTIDTGRALHCITRDIDRFEIIIPLIAEQVIRIGTANSLEQCELTNGIQQLNITAQRSAVIIQQAVYITSCIRIEIVSNALINSNTLILEVVVILLKKFRIVGHHPTNYRMGITFMLILDCQLLDRSRIHDLCKRDQNLFTLIKSLLAKDLCKTLRPIIRRIDRLHIDGTISGQCIYQCSSKRKNELMSSNCFLDYFYIYIIRDLHIMTTIFINRAAYNRDNLIELEHLDYFCKVKLRKEVQ